MRPSDARHLPFDGRPFRLRMGTRTLDLDHWIEVDERRAEELALKAELTSARRDDVVAEIDHPIARQASAELELLIRGWLGGEGVDVPTVVGEVSAIARCGLLTQEDWCVLADAGDGLVLAAATVCFPTRWILREKIGLPVAAIHRPVWSYDEQLAAPVDALLDRMGVDDPRWRLNWNLVEDDSLHQPVRRPVDPVDERSIGSRIWLRVERQTLRRLPSTGAVVFGIRIHQQPLESLRGDVEVLRRLRGAVDAMPAPTFEYKGLDRFATSLRSWIDSQVASSSQ